MSRYQFKELETDGDDVRFTILENKSLISNQRFLDLLKQEPDFRQKYNGYLVNCDFEAFFWENKPITQQNLVDDYECTLVNSEFLAGCRPDPNTFQSYFREDKPVVSFPNLGRDAQLVVPCPASKHSVYTHIGNFVRNAPEDQIQSFWKQVGKDTLNLIGEKPKWLSTSGLGVFWLQARIDSYPKYYQTKKYKETPPE